MRLRLPLFDERSNGCPVKTLDDDRAKPKLWWQKPNFEYVYVGTEIVPDDLSYIYCRNRFLALVDVVWNDSFILMRCGDSRFSDDGLMIS